jgi:flagellar hook assembly protein FlgD
MSIEEAVDRLKRLENTLPDLVQRNVEIAAFEAITAIGQRARYKGEDAKGAKFDDYTDAYKIYKAHLGTKQKPKKDENGKRLKRQVPTSPQGRYKGYVDFDLSGDLWRNIAITERKDENGKVKMVIGAKTEANQKKLEGNLKYRSPLMQTSVTETKEIQREFGQRINNEITDSFNA